MIYRYEVTMIGYGQRVSKKYITLDAAYELYTIVKVLPYEVAIHDLELQVTITDNTHGE